MALTYRDLFTKKIVVDYLLYNQKIKVIIDFHPKTIVYSAASAALQLLYRFAQKIVYGFLK